MDSMTGRTYLQRGRPVTVVTRWGPGGGPRNVLIRCEDGRLVVRPFRGLRRARGSAPATGQPNAAAGAGVAAETSFSSS